MWCSLVDPEPITVRRLVATPSGFRVFWLRALRTCRQGPGEGVTQRGSQPREASTQPSDAPGPAFAANLIIWASRGFVQAGCATVNDMRRCVGLEWRC